MQKHAHSFKNYHFRFLLYVMAVTTPITLIEATDQLHQSVNYIFPRHNNNRPVRDFRRQPRYKCNLSSFGMLRSLHLWLLTNVSEQPIGLFKLFIKCQLDHGLLSP
jgi:hypothetical protein